MKYWPKKKETLTTGGVFFTCCLRMFSQLQIQQHNNQHHVAQRHHHANGHVVAHDVHIDREHRLPENRARSAQAGRIGESPTILYSTCDTLNNGEIVYRSLIIRVRRSGLHDDRLCFSLEVSCGSKDRSTA